QVGEVSHAHQRLLAVRRRHASRWRHHGRIRPPGRAPDPRCEMTTTRKYDVIVVGAGTNGLVAAAALAGAGKKVLVVERNDEIGGQSSVVEFAPGFRAPLNIDAGWLPPLVARGLGLTNLASVKPEISVGLAMRDGGFLPLASDAFTAADVIKQRSPRDAERWAPFVHR